jgi:hypothetical protein
MLEALTAQHFDIDGPDAASILARNASEKMGISGIGDQLSWVLHEHSLVE